MKKTLLVWCGCCALSISASAQNASQTTQPNGVVVHESIGVEGKVEQTTPVTIVRTIDDWSLAECIDAMTFVDIKLIEASDEDKPRYLEQKAVIQKRIDSLNPTH